jgi:hypothetical protein
MAQPRNLDGFRDRMVAAGGELLAKTNPYEVMRFRTRYGVGVIYQGRRGRTWNQQATDALNHLEGGLGSLAPVKVSGRRKDSATVNALLARDGDRCFLCGEPLGADITVEHLVAIAHGGPNHVSNLFLAHGECNRSLGHLSAPEKVALAIAARAGRA